MKHAVFAKLSGYGVALLVLCTLQQRRALELPILIGLHPKPSKHKASSHLTAPGYLCLTLCFCELDYYLAVSVGWSHAAPVLCLGSLT